MPKRVDSNQKEIVKALRQFGASVAHTYTVGRGFPDLLIAYGGDYYLMEIKIPQAKLTPDEVEFHQNWIGKIHIVYSIEDALKAIGAI